MHTNINAINFCTLPAYVCFHFIDESPKTTASERV